MLVQPSRASTQDDIQELRNSLARQENLIAEQQKKLTAQEEALTKQREKLNDLTRLSSNEMAAASGAGSKKNKDNNASDPAGTSAANNTGPVKVAAATPTDANATAGTPLVSPKAQEPEPRPAINVLPDAGGVLTPKGTLMYENSLEYTNTTSNVFTFNGVQVAQLVLVGVLDTSSARRQIVQDSSRLRLGITNRLEADLRVPFVYRNDSTSQTDTSSNPPVTSRTSREGANIGDMDMGLSYQLNRGFGGWPFFVGNLRYKSTTGEGPFDVPYDTNNIATRLPTGTGFNSVEGSMTIIKVSDPVVLFANTGLVYSIGEDINKDFNTTRILEVNPGAVANASAGMGFAINQETSFTLGYKHSYVFPTYQTQQDLNSGIISKSRSDTLQMGSLLTGLSYTINPVVSLNFTVEAGVTRDAPDVHVGFRVPVRLGQVF